MNVTWAVIAVRKNGTELCKIAYCTDEADARRERDRYDKGRRQPKGYLSDLPKGAYLIARQLRPREINAIDYCR